MDIKLSVDKADEVKAIFAKLGTGATKAVMDWENSLGEHAQGTVRVRLPSHFTMRGTAQGFMSAVILAKATPRRPAEIKIGSNNATTRTGKLGAILAKHEESQTRTQTGQGFFLPARGRRSSTKNPPANTYPKALLANPVRGTYTKGKKGSKVIKSLGATYLFTEKGIFRIYHTVGLGRANADRMHPLWWFRSRIRTPERLHLWDTVREVFDRTAIGYGYEAVNRALSNL